MSISCKLTFIVAISIVLTTAVIVPLILKNRRHKPDVSETDPTVSTTRNTVTQASTSSVITTRITNTSTISTSTRIVTYNTTSSTIQTSTYSSSLTGNSLSWCFGGGCTNRARYYFEAVEINVSITGRYGIYSISGMDTYGFIYNSTFDSRFVDLYLIKSDDDTAGNQQFHLSWTLNAGQPYVVVLTTYSTNVTGSFSISATGPGSVTFSRIGNTTVRDWGTPLNYSSALTRNSSQFCRTTDCSTPDYFYEMIPINVSISGFYIIFTQSVMNTYGYIYSNTFNSSNLQQNLLSVNEDGSSNLQFLLALNLNPTTRYNLVVTTKYTNRTGSFVVLTYGPGSVSFG